MHRPLLLAAGALLATAVVAEEFSFDLDAIEKKSFAWRGYAELRYERLDLNRDALLTALNYPDGESVENRFATALELSGDYRLGDTRLSATWHGIASDDNRESLGQGRLYEGYLNQQLGTGLSAEFGKRTLKWGKGYAWSPVAFVERPKDPTDPELGREGYVMATGDWIKSGNGPLQTVGLTPVVLPVHGELNDEFGSNDANNLAAKLYLLYRDVDIDLMFLANGIRQGRVGADFSMNLASHIELHGEWAYIPDHERHVVEDGQFVSEVADAHNLLLGLRYLTESDTTWIVEWLHQSHGYREAEMVAYFDLLAASANPAAVAEAGQQAGFLRPNPMRNYLYLRVSQKEPFDWLYGSATLGAIVNPEDGSYLLMPELAYIGLRNTELRLRLTLLEGGHDSEFGEKVNRRKVEFRTRYFF